MPRDTKRRLSAAAFVALLLLSIFWPAPVIEVNQLCCHAALPIDELSFLGREAPAWDVVFWCIAGLFALALLQPSDHYRLADFAEAWRDVKTMRPRLRGRLAGVVTIALLIVAGVWRYLDEPVTWIAERVQSNATEDWIRIFNRLGGGMNPGLIVLYFLIAGTVYRHRRWVAYAVAMALAGAGAGIFAQIVKYLVGRTRPELWLGAFQHARGSATSFPSGHTIGAFALGGVLLFGSRSLPLRVVSLLLAMSVGVARILAFRHWSSDVLASAILGLLFAWVFVEAVVTPVTRPAAPRP